MLERLGHLMEILSIVLCIHILYGKKFQLNIKNIVLCSFDVILLQAINENVVSQKFVLLIYIMVFIYCCAEFGYKKKEIFINNALNFVILFMVQILCWVVFVLAQLDSLSVDKQVFLLNFMSVSVVALVLPKCKLNRLSKYMQEKHLLVNLALAVCMVFVLYMFVSFRITKYLLMENYLMVVVSGVLLMLLVYKWQENRFQVREQALQLEINSLYNETFQTLLAEIRGKQHDFENHIQAIYAQHYTANTLDELVEKQKKYCECVTESNKYNKLLKLGDSTFVGFLYGKFLHAEEKGIEIKYDINIENSDCKLPIYKFVELVGNLFDNAVEAVLANDEVKKEIFIQLSQTNEKIIFSIRNPGEYISQEKINEMFQQGKSSKGQGRGLGLSNVSKICKEYSCELYVENKMIEEENYIEFQVQI